MEDVFSLAPFVFLGGVAAASLIVVAVSLVVSGFKALQKLIGR